jgi:spermidine/putrescine transport system substrate-binding protein
MYLKRISLALAVAAACAVSAWAASPPILFNWEDYVNAPFLAQYKKQFKETPRTQLFADEDEALAKMRAGFKPDVMGVCSYEFTRWREAGLLQPIDTTKLKNWSKIAPTLKTIPGMAAGPNKVWFVPHYWGNTSITLRADLAPEYAKSQSWNILFDPKYKGRVAVLDGVDDTIPFIAKMIGIDAYNMTPQQWEKVQAKLRALVKQTRMVSSDNTALVQGLASGEIVAAMSWRTVYTMLKAEKKKVIYMNPPGGIFTYVCGLVMHKNADPVKATALIDSNISDEAATFGLRSIGDGPANIEVLKKEPQATFDRLGFDRDVEKGLKSGTFQQRLKNKDKIVETWAEIRSGL